MLSPKGFIDTITLEFKSQENVVPPSLSSFSAAVAKKNLPKTPHGHMVMTQLLLNLKAKKMSYLRVSVF